MKTAYTLHIGVAWVYMLNKAGHLYFFMSHFEISRLFLICIFFNLIYVVLNKVLKKEDQ